MAAGISRRISTTWHATTNSPSSRTPSSVRSNHSPPPTRRINQLRCINQRKHTYHPLEVAEAEPTEVEDVEEVEEDNVGNHVGTKIETVRHTEQHHRRPEEPRRRHKE